MPRFALLSLLLTVLACAGCHASPAAAADARPQVQVNSVRPQVITSYSSPAQIKTVRFPLARGVIRAVRDCRQCQPCCPHPQPLPAMPSPPAEEKPREQAAEEVEQEASDESILASALAFVAAAGGSFLAAARRRA